MDWAMTNKFFKAHREFTEGNFNLNRKITAAPVARQPFGEFSLFGIGSQTGGPEYPPQIPRPLTSSEYIKQQGFALWEENF